MMNRRTVITIGIGLVSFLALMLIGTRPIRSQPLPASAGTEFYTMLPSLALADNAKLRLMITATASTNVTVTFLDVDSSITQFVETGMSREVVIPRGRIEVIGVQETRSDRALRIVAEQPITVQAYHDAEYFTDAWVILPTTGLGLDHRVMSFDSDDDLNFNGGVAAVVATQDNTTLRITPTVTTASGNSPGFTYGISLNRGEVWQVVPRIPERTDLSGTRLQGDRPIAVIGGHRGAAIVIEDDAANPMVESVPPISQWGKEFYGIPPPGRDTGYYKIVAARDNTLVRINGSDLALLNAGGTVRRTVAGPAAITATGPIIVAEFTRHRETDTTGMNADPSMTLLQPTRGWATSYLWTTPSLDLRPWPEPTSPERFVPFAHFLLVTAPTGSSDPILLDGADISANLTTLHVGGNYRSGVVAIDTGTHSLTCGIPVGAQLVGYNHYDAYFLPAGYVIPAPVEAGPIIGSTCGPAFDTTITLRSMRAQALRVESATFVGVTGTILSPGFPLDLPPFAERSVRVRIDLGSFGENMGTILFHLAGDSLSDIEIPVRIARDSLAGDILEDILLFPDATLTNPVHDTMVTVVNTGMKPLRIEAASVPLPFEILDSNLPTTLAPGDTLRLRIRFAPGNPGVYDEELKLATGPCDIALTTILRGKRSDPAVIEVRATVGPTLVCPDETPGEFTVTIHNRGGETITLAGAGIEGDARDDFRLADDPSGETISPGDSLVLTLRFNPSETGERRAIVRILHDLSPGFTLVEVSARKDSAGLEFAQQTIDFGQRLLCIGPERQAVRLRNTGTVPVRIDSVVLRSGMAFTSTTSYGFPIPPGDSAVIEVDFAPPSFGPWNDTLLVFGSPCALQAGIPLHGIGLGSALSVPIDTLNFGEIPLCFRPDTLTTRLVNDGDAVDTIVSVEVLGSGFRMEGLSDSVLLPGEESALSFIFEPAEPGDYAAEVIVRANPCDLVRRFVLKGSLGRVSIAAPIPDVELGTVLPGVPLRVEAALRNTGEFPITLDSVTFGDMPEGLRLISPAVPFSLMPGDSISLLFEYLSTGPEGFETKISLFTSPCPLGLSFMVRGDRGPGRMELVLPDTAANVDETISLPLRLTGGGEFDERVRLVAEVRWDLQNLLLRRTIDGTAGALTVLTDSIAAEKRVVRFGYDGTIPPDGLLGRLDLLVLLGSDDTTGLDGTILEATLFASGASLDVTARDGSFRTLGICAIDGARFIRIDDRLQGGKARPNPAVEFVTIPFFSRLPGVAELTIYDVRGDRTVMESRISIEAGRNELNVDVSRIPSGLYFYRLKIEREEVRDVLVIRR